MMLNLGKTRQPPPRILRRFVMGAVYASTQKRVISLLSPVVGAYCVQEFQDSGSEQELLKFK